MTENIGGSLRQIILPYPNFELGTIIDPFEHNANNSETVIKINQMVTVLNSFINSEANTNLSAMAMYMPAVEPILGSDLETFLRTLIGYIRSVEAGNSGAHFVQSAPIAGVPGDNIYEQLSFISEAITGRNAETGAVIPPEAGQEVTLSGQIQKLITDLSTHKAGGDHDSRYYTKREVDDILGGGEEGESNSFLTVEGDFEGTWKGWTLEDIRSFSGKDFGTIEVLARDPINPKPGRIWIIGSNDDYEWVDEPEEEPEEEPQDT